MMHGYGYDMHGYGMPGYLTMLVGALIILIPFWKLWKRTGHNPWISLLMLIPIVNLIMLYVLAFKDWPSDNEKAL